MGKVTRLDDFRPHETGIVQCLLCGTEYVAVWPVALDRLLECSSCGKASCAPVTAIPWIHLTMKEVELAAPQHILNFGETDEQR